MSHCTVCGETLFEKFLENEGMIPYCEHCEEFRFPMFNTAISAIVYNPTGDQIVLIKQYGRDLNVLVAGYVTKGEGVEQTLVREVKEEMGLDVIDYTFNASEYFEKSNTLMVNFACKVDSDSLEHTNEEVDSAAWYSPEDILDHMKDGILAKRFVETWLNKKKYYR